MSKRELAPFARSKMPLQELRGNEQQGCAQGGAPPFFARWHVQATEQAMQKGTICHREEKEKWPR